MAAQMGARDAAWIDILVMAVDHALADLRHGHDVDGELIRDLEALSVRLRAERAELGPG
jgi:hypothetical protein